MTREEAIICKSYLNDLDRTHDCNEYKLLMALLDREPCEDAVSRKAMLDAITEIDDNTNMDIYTNEVREIINDLSPVTPVACIATVKFSKEDMQELVDKKVKELAQHMERKWIPVSEKLPEDFQRVLVTIVNYNGDKVVRVAEYSRRTFKIKENYEHWQVGEKGLLAWRPLPKPYKVESEEK